MIHISSSSCFRALRKVALWIGSLVLAVGLLVLVAYPLRAPILRSIAAAWIVDEPPAQADAIIILGGGVDIRPQAAAKLLKEGHAPRILILSPRNSPERDRTGLPSGFEEAAAILKECGVASDKYEEIGPGVTSTMEELQAIAQWAQANKAKTVIIPTHAFHTRRVNLWADKVLGPLGIDTRTVALEDHRYPTNTWWTHEEGLIGFQNEVAKFAMYLARF